jgi:hypothetical protein
MAVPAKTRDRTVALRRPGSEWLNGLSNPVSESYHPNRTGQSSGYLPLVRQVVG